jgi:AcrR family transcriptional regulator
MVCCVPFDNGKGRKKVISVYAMARSTRSDWCEQGFALLRESGPQAITVEKLCERLRLTKGSFYHHFVDIFAFQDAMLERWQEQLTALPIAQSSKESTPEKKGKKLEGIVRGLDHELDIAIRAWALSDARARAAVLEVDVQRMRFLGALHKDAGRARAELLGELEYAAFVGLQHLPFTTARKASLSLALAESLRLLAMQKTRR